MATGSQVNVGVNVSTTGLKEANKEAGQLHTNLKGAAEAAQKVRVPGPVAAARQGVAAQRTESQQYGVARSAVGTGAEGRDFAKQSQGLGGLVRLYATYAANLFAVSAAYGALSRAADTTNLIKGLDQLGAASGRSLGTLSKQLAAASDGALSLRDAMQATAQASAAGMSNTAILRMGEAATKAAQALGVAMPDAMSRISRGITKLEPELLDELGIFVRVDKASQDYARSLGKTASSLTDFEKRQGFANAVLTQAEQKFGNIEINANPYAKLLASMQNLAQTGLELANKVLTPIVNLLSSSPVALSTVMAGIAGLILKQAIPALGEFRKNLEETTLLAAKKAQERYLAQQAAEIAIDTQVARSAENRYKLQNDYFNKIIALENNAGQFTNTTRVKWAKLATQNILEISDQELKSLSKRATSLKSSDADQAKRLKDQIAGIREVQRINREAENAGNLAQEKREEASSKFFSQESLLRRQSINTGREVTKDHIYNMAYQSQATLGAKVALTELYKTIAESKKGIMIPTGQLDEAGQAITRLGPATTIASRGIMYLSGTIRVAIASVGTAVMAFLPWIEVIALAVTGITLLVSWLGNTKKEAEETSKAISNLDGAIEGATKTIDAINKKPLLEQLSVESIQAKATALDELVTATRNAVEKSNAELAKMGAASTFKNWVSKAWGGDVQSELNEKISESLTKSFKLLNQGPSAEQARKTVSNILGTSVTNSEELEKALNSMGDKGKSAIAQLVPELDKLSQSSSVSAAKGKELKDSFAQTNKTFDEFVNSLRATDTYSKLGTGMIDSAQKLDLALKDPTTSLNAMLEVVKDVNNLRLFPEATAKNILATTDQIKKMQVEQANANQQLVNFDNELAKLEKSKFRLGGIAETPEKLDEINQKIKEIAKQKAVQIDVIANVQAKTGELETVFKKAVLEQFKQGASVVSARLAKDFAEASSVLKTGLAGMLGDTKAGIMLRAQYEKESLAVQAEGIKQQINLAKVTEHLAIEMELNRVAAAKEKIEAKGAKGDDKEYLKLVDEEKKLQARKQDLESKKAPGYKQTADLMGSGKIPLDTERLRFLEALQAGQASLAKINAQVKLVDIKTAVELTAKELQTTQELNTQKTKTLQIDRSRLDTLSSIVGEDDPELLQQKQKLDNQLISLDNANALIDKEKQIALFKRLTNEFTKAGNYQAAVAADKEAQRAEADKQALESAIKKQKVIKDEVDKVADLKVGYDQQQKSQAKLYQQLEEAQKLEQDRLQNAEGLLSVQQDLSLITEQDYLKQKLVSDLAKSNLDTQQKIDLARKAEASVIGEAELKLAQLRTLPVTADVTKQIAIQEQIIKDTGALYDAQVTSLLKSLGITIDITKARSGFAIELATRKKEQELLDRQYETLVLIKQIEQERLGYEEALLANKKESGAITDESYIKQKLQLDLLRQGAEAQNKLDELNRNRTQKLAEPERVIGAIQAINPADRTKEQNTQLAEQQSLVQDINTNYATQYQGLFQLLNLNTSLTKSKAEQDLLQAQFNEKLKTSEQLTQNLSAAFGDLGNALGGFVATLVNLANEDEKYLARKADLEKDLKDPAKAADATKALTKLDKDRSNSEIANISKVASAGKKMFEEKSRGYRLLTAIEKAASVVSAGIQAAQLAQTIATTAKKIGIDIPAIYASFMKWLGPWGTAAAGAAIATFIGGAFGGGGGSTVDMTGKMAADRQASQGTGTVTGDSSAKSESIANSLEIVSSNSVEGLSYSNRMVELLTDINKGISGVAKGVYGVVGLSSGSMFGTKEGTTGYNFLGGLFGDKTTREITDAGLALKGTFADFAKNAKDFAKTYEDVLTTSTSSFLWFSSTSQSLNTQLKELDPKVAKAISGVFQNAGEMFVKAGEDLGMTQKSVEDMLAAIDLTKIGKISTRGLKGQELVDALTGSLSAMLDTAANTVFKQVEEFNKFGEGMLQTAVRVTDGLSKVNLAMQSIGKQVVGSGVSGIRISEALIDAAGGLSEFIDKTKTFNSKFLTEAERLAPIQAAVNKELNSLGYASNLTKEQFKQLILGFKVTNDASAVTYNKLLDLAQGVDELATASETAAKKLVEAGKDQLIKIFNLLYDTGRDLLGSEKALALTRERELEALDAALRPGQQYIYALEDEKNLKSKLSTATSAYSNALKTTISSLKASIKSLKDYKTALTAGSSSILTPTERYAQARLKLLATASAAKNIITPTSTKEEILARDQALSELSGTSDTFLTASRDLFASSEQYTQDFKSVLDILDGNTATLENQLTEAERSLNSLESIEENTKTTAELLQAYTTAQAEYRTAQTATNAARELYESNSLTQAASDTAQVITAIDVSKIANDLVTSTAATTVANAVTGTTTALTTDGKTVSDAVTDAAVVNAAIADGRDIAPSGWSTMTAEQQSNYFAENPTMAAISRAGITAFGFTTLGMIQDIVTGGKAAADALAVVNGALSTAAINAADAIASVGAGLSNSDAIAAGISAGSSSQVEAAAAANDYGFDLFAEGGLATGWSIVGEKGPELVDFKTPGRVYSNRASSNLLNNDALIEEIRALRQEVTQLRAEQREQTGHIISTNYDANTRNANAIVTGNKNVLSQENWKMRSAVVVA